MHHSIVVAATLAVAALASKPVHPQAISPAAIGERVRITTPTQRGPDRVLGQVVAARADSLVVQTPGVATPRAVAIGEISTLEVSQGMHGNGGRGMAYGSLIGVAVGGLLGAATYTKPDCNGAFLCPSPESSGIDVVAGGLLGGLVGLGVGGLWGAAHPSERWQARPLGTAPRVGIIPARRGAVLVLHAVI